MVNYKTLIFLTFLHFQLHVASDLIYKVYQVTPRNSVQLESLHRIWEDAHHLDLDFWRDPSNVGVPCDVMVPPKSRIIFLNQMNKLNVSARVIIENVEKLIIERERKANYLKWMSTLLKDSTSNFDNISRTRQDYFDVFQYHSYSEVVDYLNFVERKYPAITKVLNLGHTHEGRLIKMIKIGYPVGSTTKRAIWIDGGIHAREWVSQATALYFIHSLVNGYATKVNMTEYVQNFTWYIVPNLNPDGYEFSRSSTRPEVRSWRKNRSMRPGCGREICCSGVDLNRNFDFYWSEYGSSSNRCSHTYHGTKKFSEQESAAVRNFVTLHRHEIDAFITLHSYSQFWVYPYGHVAGAYPYDVKDLNYIARKATKALQSRYGTIYKVGSSADLLRYGAAGGSDDWAKSKMGIKFVYLLELRPDEHVNFGFILDEEHLKPTLTETWEGVKVVADAVWQVDRIKKERLRKYYGG